jgi:hypothetical protein
MLALVRRIQPINLIHKLHLWITNVVKASPISAAYEFNQDGMLIITNYELDYFCDIWATPHMIALSIMPSMSVRADFMRCIIGNPCQPLHIENRSYTTISLATKVYKDQDWSALPVLADQLEEIGCVDELALDHLRRDTVHTPSCFVLEACLAKK